MNRTNDPRLDRRMRAALLPSVALLAVAAAPAPSGHDPRPGCPDQGVKEKKSTIRYGAWQKCGTGVSVSANGLALHNPQNLCPLFAVYEPPRDVPTPKKGFRAAPGGQLPITMITFRCVDRWLLGFIPIPIGSHCRVEKTRVTGHLQNYVETACARDAGAGAGDK